MSAICLALGSEVNITSDVWAMCATDSAAMAPCAVSAAHGIGFEIKHVQSIPAGLAAMLEVFRHA